MPRRRSMACAAKARGKQRAFIHGLEPTFATAQKIQSASSTAKRLKRLGVRLAHEKMRAGAHKARRKLRHSKHEGCFAQISAPDRLQLHCISLGTNYP